MVLIPLKLVRDGPLQEQLYEQLRDLIDSGRLKPDTRMPSTRLLAEQFAISRTTVVLTYERLVAEGRMETLPAMGTFVCRPRAVPARSAAAPAPDGARSAPPTARIGRPDPSFFPTSRWRSLMRGALDRLPGQSGAEHPAGNPALRTAIAGWLSVSRGLAVAADQVVLVSGRQQAVHVVGHLALTQGARAVVEDPGDPKAAGAFVCSGASLVRVPVDADGLRTDRLPDGRVALAHVTPEHQHPIGVRLSRDRRGELLAWAARAGALVLEDDCDGDLGLGGAAVPSLMSLDQAESVVFIGGFATTLGPWLTLAYMVVPRRLIAATIAARQLVDDGARWLEEAALAEFMRSGDYARHVHRLGKAYARRRAVLVAALRAHFDAVPIWGGGAGLSLTVFPSRDCDHVAALANFACRHGLDAAATQIAGQYADQHDSSLLLGFGSLTERMIEAGIAQCAGAAWAHGRGAPPVDPREVHDRGAVLSAD